MGCSHSIDVTLGDLDELFKAAQMKMPESKRFFTALAMRREALDPVPPPANITAQSGVQRATAVQGSVGPRISSERGSHDVWIENIGRMTNREMAANYEALRGQLPRDEELVIHFTELKWAKMIIAPDSLGLKASVAGQLGGGLSVCKVGPHALGWEPWGSGTFCEQAGRMLWGEKWADVLPGHRDHDKLAICLVIRIAKTWYDDVSRVLPGRSNVLIIPKANLMESGGSHWLQRARIVKAYAILDLDGEHKLPALLVESVQQRMHTASPLDKEMLKSVDDLIATPPQPQPPTLGIQAPAPVPDGEPQPEPQASAAAAALDQRVAATESQAELRRVKSTPHPEPEGEPVDEAHPFRCCLDRPYVQKEIRWAQKYGKVRDTPTVPVLYLQLTLPQPPCISRYRASEGGRELNALTRAWGVLFGSENYHSL